MAKDLNGKTVKIKSVQKATARNGSEYYKLTIQDSESKIHNAVIWDCCNINEIGLNNEINISCSYDPNYKNYTINYFSLVKEGRRGLTAEEQENLFGKLIQYTQPAYSKNFSPGIQKMLEDINIFWTTHKDLLMLSPAAVTHHHNYIGGLLQHISELIDFIFKNGSDFEDDNSFALCIAGALMHDAGKIFEYSADVETGVVSYQEAFREDLYLAKEDKLSPHILFAYQWALERGYKELAHIIGAHHNITDHGAMFTPVTKEAQLVFMADYYSSRFGKISIDMLGDLPEKELQLIGEDEIPF